MSFPCCPSLSVYAAIQMDPTAMVAHLDAQAIEEAREIHPKTYLILSSSSLEFPLPGQSWYGFNVCLVGPSLRAVDERLGFESHMCVPIFPNEAHPTGRRPVRPDGKFAYDNCYHWAGLDMDVRVHAREAGFDNARAIRLPPSDWVDMSSTLDLDQGRAMCTRFARQQAVSVPRSSDKALAFASESSSLDASEQQGDTAPSARASGEVDIFEPPVDFEDPEYMPLAHLWLDLPANLKQEDIGDPIDLYRERFAITSIIQRAHERNSGLPTLREHVDPHAARYIGGSDCESYMSGTASGCASEAAALRPSHKHVSKPKRFGAAKLLQKFSTSVRQVLCIPI